MFKNTIILFYMIFFFALPRQSLAGEYSLTIERKPVNYTGKTVNKITINGTIPGPTLHFTEGEDVYIHVTNKMSEDTSIHWHGMLVPGIMDGVPGFNGFPGIKPHETFTYHFKIRQSGTYWYHAHSMGQEQDGHYGAIIIAPREKNTTQADRDYVVLLSDFTDEESSSILANLKMSSDYYANSRRTIIDFLKDTKAQGLQKTWQERKMWGEMRMLPTDLSDVSGYTFLMNGKTTAQNWTGLFNKDEKIRIRFINASAMTIYDVRIPGLKMELIAADGQNVEPVIIDEFRFGVAETYDVIVKPKDNKAYTIAAEPIDRSGFALGTLAPQLGMKAEAPKQRPRTLLSMADMGMEHMDHSDMDHSDMDHSDMDHSDMDHSDMDPKMTMHHDMRKMNSKAMANNNKIAKGWSDASTPVGNKALSYSDLRFLGTQGDTRKPEREILVRLGGNMERYIWTINGKKYSESGPINLKYKERVRLKFVNDTMMAHPMHLHGMFVQLENGQPAEKMPNKHTLIVPPGQSYSVLLTADEPGEWAFHCHLLYHMMSGMMNKVVVATLDPIQIQHDNSSISPSHYPADKDENIKEHKHVH